MYFTCGHIETWLEGCSRAWQCDMMTAITLHLKVPKKIGLFALFALASDFHPTRNKQLLICCLGKEHAGTWNLKRTTGRLRQCGVMALHLQEWSMSFDFLHTSFWFPSDKQQSAIDPQGNRARTKPLLHLMEAAMQGSGWVGGVGGVGLQQQQQYSPHSACAYVQLRAHSRIMIKDSVRNSWGNGGLKPLNKWQVIFSWEQSEASEAINHFGDHPCRFQSSPASSRLMTSIDRDKIAWQVWEREREKCALCICWNGRFIDFKKKNATFVPAMESSLLSR